MRLKSILLFVVVLPFSSKSFAQTSFQVDLKFPIGLNTEKVKIFYSNGKEWKKIGGGFINNEVTIADSLFAKFATISCMYYETPERSAFGKTFFVGENPATIVINETKESLTDPFSDCKLTNALDVKKTESAKQLALTTADESKDYNNFLAVYGDKLDNNDSLKTLGKLKRNKLLNKEIGFIKDNGDQYYAFWIFKNEVLSHEDFLAPDSLLRIFHDSFTQDLKNTFEGRAVESALAGRANIAGKSYAPYFKTVDIQNKPVDLKDFKGKYVLLNFWASWCVPCIQEMGTIKKLYDKYGQKNLVVISVSIDQDKKSFMEAVKKYKMNWINIFHDLEIENIFLKGGGIPQVYLIDVNGKLIYSREEEKDYDLSQLKKIIRETSL